MPQYDVASSINSIIRGVGRQNTRHLLASLFVLALFTADIRVLIKHPHLENGRAGSLLKMSVLENQSGGDIIVSGHTSVVYLTNPPLPMSRLIDGAEAELGKVSCTDFTLHPIGEPLRRVIVTSTGLGDVKFWLKAGDNEQMCQEAPAEVSSILLIENLDETVQIRARLGPFHHMKPDTSLSGTLIVQADQQDPKELSLRVERQDTKTIITAFNWFGGILVPTLVAAIVTFLFAQYRMSRDKRREQQVGFHFCMLNNQDKIKELFEDFFPEAVKKDAIQFSIELRKELEVQDILKEIPDRERSKLDEKFRKGDRKGAIKLLRQLFPDWKDKIKEHSESRPGWITKVCRKDSSKRRNQPKK